MPRTDSHGDGIFLDAFNVYANCGEVRGDVSDRFRAMYERGK